MKQPIVIGIVALLAGCAGQPASEQAPAASALDSSEHPKQYVEQAYQFIADKNHREALNALNKAVELCSDYYNDPQQTVYAARTTSENLLYLLQAASNEQQAITVDTTCSDALYLKGFTSLNFGKIEEAEELVKRAIDMAPANALYLAELGHILHVKKQWQEALAIFTQAEEAAENFSPQEVQAVELTRAKRGIGFSLIELNRLDEAEAKFKECLEIDPKDEGALRELEYIEHLRQSQQ